MAAVERIEHGDVLELRLRGGRGNALDPALLRELEAELARASSAGAPALLLSSAGRSFSTGLDLRHALACDRAGIEELMTAFHHALCELLFYPAPTLAAVGGHALAGGALLALCCDERILAVGAGRVGIHGAQLGIGYPDIAIEIVRRRFDRAQVEDILYAGELFEGDAARIAGFVGEIVQTERLEDRALEWLRARAAGPAFALNKARLSAPARSRLLPMDAGGLQRFVDHWFAADTQRRLAEAVARLSTAEGGERN